MNLLFGELTHEEVKQAIDEEYMVILPLGSIEQHGPHLPVDTDLFQGTEMALEGARAARKRYGLEVLVLPTIPYGNSLHHLGFPGTISLSYETLIAVVYEVLTAVAEQGFRRIVLVTGHAGNEPALTAAATRVKYEQVKAGREVEIFNFRTAYYADLVSRVWEERRKVGDSIAGPHAAGCETAWCLAKREHLVKKDKIGPPPLNEKAMASKIWGTRIYTSDEVSANGSFGRSDGATKELGEQIEKARGALRQRERE